MDNKQHDDTEATTVALRDFIESFQADSAGESCYDDCESKRRRRLLLEKMLPELSNRKKLHEVINYWKTKQEKCQGLFNNRRAVLSIIKALLKMSSKKLSQDATSEYGFFELVSPRFTAKVIVSIWEIEMVFNEGRGASECQR